MNWKQNNSAKLLLIAELVYNNAKNASINHTSFKLNCEYYLQVFFQDEINSYSKSLCIKKLADKVKKLIEIHCQYLFHE